MTFTGAIRPLLPVAGLLEDTVGWRKKRVLSVFLLDLTNADDRLPRHSEVLP